MTYRKSVDLETTVEVWCANIKDFTFDDFFYRHEYMLGMDELDRIGNFLLEKDRFVCLVSRVLLRLVLSWYSPCTCPSTWQFSKNKYGKPYLNCDQFPGLEFNLTHSGDIVLCAFTRSGAVGIDIETAGLMKNVDAVVNRFFAAEEKDFFKTLADFEKNEFFFRLWTIKESYVKAIGAGMQIPFDGFSIDARSIATGPIKLCYEFDHTVREWQFFQHTYSSDFYPVSIAVLTTRQLGLVWRDPSFLKL